MARKDFDIKKIAAELGAILKKDGISVERVILYGSRARGNAHADSDIDLVIISKDLKKFDPIERLEYLSQIAWRISAPLEIIGYTPDEVKNKSGKSIMWDEIQNTGKTIYKAA